MSFEYTVLSSIQTGVSKLIFITHNSIPIIIHGFSSIFNRFKYN